LRPAWPKPTFRTLTVTTSEWPLGDATNGRLEGMSLGNGGVYNYTHIYIYIYIYNIYINDGIQLRDSRTIIVKLRLTKSSKSCTNSVHVPRAQRNRELGCNRSSGVWMLYFRCISLI
jgi:hypothetical protein